jgi:hypothetical protein
VKVARIPEIVTPVVLLPCRSTRSAEFVMKFMPVILTAVPVNTGRPVAALIVSSWITPE